MPEPALNLRVVQAAILGILREVGLVGEESPGGELKAQRASELLAGVVRTAWDNGHRVRASELLALRGELRVIRERLRREEARRAAAEAEVRSKRTALRTTESRGAALGLWVSARDRSSRATDEELDETIRRERRRSAEIRRLEDKVTRQRIVIRLLVSLGVLLAGSLGTWGEVHLAHLSGFLLYLVAAGTLGLDGLALVLIWVGQRRAVRLVGWLLVCLQITADVLQVLSFKRR